MLVCLEQRFTKLTTLPLQSKQKHFLSFSYGFADIEGDCHRSYKSVGQAMSGYFSARPIFDALAVECNEEYLD